MRRIVARGAMVLLFCTIGPISVLSANPDFCRDYANAAVDQTRAASDGWRCRAAPLPPRWSTNWRDHYDWCLGTRWEYVRREREIRHDHLLRCHYR